MKKKNKRGQMGMVLFVVLLLVILILGFISAIGLGIISWVSNQITPEIQNIGNVEGVANFTEAAQYSFVPANNFIQALPWVLGFIYFAALIFSIVFAVWSSQNANLFFLGMYFFLMILLIFGAIIISNMYQDIYNGNDMLGQQLHLQTTMSFMILRAPIILLIISVITGIIIFSGVGNNWGGGGI